MTDFPFHGDFHPRVRQWFESRVGAPTRIQRKAWPLIAGGRHVLITAPTGSGKTLTAFLWALDRLIRGCWETGQTRVLYVSPLKALNNDVRRNLIQPLVEIRRFFESDGDPFPKIRVAVRSGDTPADERRRMLRRPPEILITTPESLHLLLSSHGGRSMLGRIRTVIVDEIHAVAGNKRGTLLMSAVDRLVPLCGEFQRIALSATVNPEATVARFVAGFTVDGDPLDPVYTPRTIEICRDGRQPVDAIRVHIPLPIMGADPARTVWDELADTFRRVIETRRATIIFVNSRRLCERLTFMINADRSQPVAYAHHGSLSRELRLEVEQRLKKGDLKAIVATSSLELGIDIGSLDQVILVQSPSSITSAVQRIGRSGHRVGETSRADFFTSHATDALTAAVLAESVMARAIESVCPVDCPLDVLAQVLVSMIGVEAWNVDALYHAICASYPFRRLQRRAFDLVIEMLAGRYAATRIAALKPKIAVDRLDNTVVARKGALLTLYTSGGVIPDRGYFGLRHEETGARIGELDEEFVWEAKKGQVFTLGNQNWRIQRITHNDVFVRPARPRLPVPPFWRAEEVDRDFYLADRIARFLENAQNHLTDPAFGKSLRTRFGLDDEGARYLMEFLLDQQQKTGCALPHRHHVVLEQIPASRGVATFVQVVIHTFWGGRVNRPFALALSSAWERSYGYVPSIFPTNDALYLLLPRAEMVDDIMTLVSSMEVETLLRGRLEASGHFGTRFRECAARALLLPRQRFNQRMPLWLSRQQSQRLLDVVGRFTDFPILIETWRTCLQDDFDMAALVRVLRELEQGEIVWSTVVTTSPSPMARTGSWRQINQYMYADDRPAGRMNTDLSPDLLQEVVFNSALRPAVDATTVDTFQEKRQRLHPGYAPDGSIEILEWVKERLLIPHTEWRRLLERVEKDGSAPAGALLDPIRTKLLRLTMDSPTGKNVHLVVAREMAPTIAHVLYPGRSDVGWTDLSGRLYPIEDLTRERVDPMPSQAEIVGQWLGYYGPVSTPFIQHALGLENTTLSGILSDLLETRSIISGELIHGRKTVLVCQADNFDLLLRMARRARTAVIEPHDIGDLVPVLAHFQGIVRSGGGGEDVAACLQRLMCLPLPAALWETEILPARLDTYRHQHMDQLMQASSILWIGFPGRKIAFCHEDDLDLMADGHDEPAQERSMATPSADEAEGLFPDRRGRYRLTDLVGDPPRPVHTILKILWAGVWAGRVTNDTMMALRQGLATDFQAATGLTPNRPMDRGVGARRRWRRPAGSGQRSSGSVGNWRLIEPPAPPDGLIGTEELVKDRVRLLMDRYGILFRQLLDRELPLLQWPAIFRALRLMELSGEVIAGCFFKDIPGLQFVSRRMLRLLHEKLPEDRLYWVSSLDPASGCGLRIDALKGTLPRRSAGSHLVYLGRRLAMVSRRNGRHLEIQLPVGHPRLSDCYSVLDHLLGRSMDAMRSITVETINGEVVSRSPYLDLLRERFDTVMATTAITLYKRLTA